MWGAIIGDLAGSIYEFEQINQIKGISTNQIIPDKGFFSDDTILTIAILDAVLSKQGYEKKLKEYGKKYERYLPNHTPYFKTTFSPGFTKWVNGDYTYNPANTYLMDYTVITDSGVMANYLIEISLASPEA